MNKNSFLSTCIKITALLVLGLAACAPSTQVPPLTGEPTPAQNTILTQTVVVPTPAAGLAYPAPEKSATLPSKAIILAYPVPSAAPMLGEAPAAIMDFMLKDLEKRAGIPPVNLTILRSEAVTWNDGALGCPKPGMMYTQAIVEGYWVVVQINGKTYDYRITSRGPTLMLCEK